MSGPYRRGSATRPHTDYRSYSARQKILGPTASRVPPAWRYPYQRPRQVPILNESELVNLGGGYANLPQQEGSKIYISHLPADVDDLDVYQLLTETIGPVIYAFVVYDARGLTKMAAVASFVDSAHAAKAVELYNGKVIDGKEPIQVEQIGLNPKARVGVSPTKNANGSNSGKSAAPATSKSLLDRVSQVSPASNSLLNRVSARPMPPASTKKPQTQGNPANTASHPPPKPKRFVKKGPKRLQKLAQLQQLEQEMDQYRNSAPNGLGLLS